MKRILFLFSQSWYCWQHNRLFSLLWIERRPFRWPHTNSPAKRLTTHRIEKTVFVRRASVPARRDRNYVFRTLSFCVRTGTCNHPDRILARRPACAVAAFFKVETVRVRHTAGTAVVDEHRGWTHSRLPLDDPGFHAWWPTPSGAAFQWSWTFLVIGTDLSAVRCIKRKKERSPLIFRKHSFKISATNTYIKNSNRTYIYFGINSLKRNIVNPSGQNFKSRYYSYTGRSAHLARMS